MISRPLLVIIIGLVALLGGSVTGNVMLLRANTTLSSKLAAQDAKGTAELNACAITNTNVTASATLLGSELAACRGQEQKVNEQRDLAMRQRDRARRAAEGEAQMRHEAVEAIARNDETCRRPICRALSDELLGTRPNDPAQ